MAAGEIWCISGQNMTTQRGIVWGIE